ncbi:MAG TPA: hypothetical protein VE440_00260 [Gaiellaceae bacterium]|nr:hypothetical protein [Gaiellaceae bacterium]
MGKSWTKVQSGHPGSRATPLAAVPHAVRLLMTGEPYGEAPVFNAPFVD